MNTSMYDAQQGSTSGAHIDMSTASGTNNIHGTAYLHRGTNWLNADPLFLQRRSEYSGQRKESRPAPIYAPAGRSACRSRRTSSSFMAATSTRTHPTMRSVFRGRSCRRISQTIALTGLATAANNATTFASPLNANTVSPAPVTVASNFSGTPCGSGVSNTCGINPIAYTMFNYQAVRTASI